MISVGSIEYTRSQNIWPIRGELLKLSNKSHQQWKPAHRDFSTAAVCVRTRTRGYLRGPPLPQRTHTHTLFCEVFSKYTRCIWETSTSSCSVLDRALSVAATVIRYRLASVQQNRNFLKLLSRLTQLACGVKWFSLDCTSLSSWAQPQICRWDYLSDLIQTRSLEMNAREQWLGVGLKQVSSDAAQPKNR